MPHDCRPELILRGISNSIEGVNATPSKLPQENINRGDPSQKAFGTTLRVGSERGLFPLSIEEEISRSARHDKLVVFCNLGLVGKGTPLPIMCHHERSEGSPLMEEGCALLQLHPNDFMNLGESWKGGILPLSI